MLGYGLPGRIKMSGKCIWRHSLYSDERYDRPSSRVGDGLENISSHFFVQSVYETDWLQVYAQLFGFASSFCSFLKSQKLRRNFQAWRAVGSNDLFDAAWAVKSNIPVLLI